MRRIIYLTILTLVSFQNSAFAKNILRVGLFSVPPHVFSGHPQMGASVNYLNEFAKAYNYEIKWLHEVPFPRLLDLLEKGSIDVVPLISKTKERSKYLYYPKIEMFESEAVLIVNNNSRIKTIESINDIAGINITYMQDAILPKMIRENKGSVTFTFIGSDDWVTKGVSSLRKGWTDAILSLNQYTVKYELKKLGLSTEISAIPIPRMGERDLTYTAISKKSPYSKKLILQFDEWAKMHPYRQYLSPYID